MVKLAALVVTTSAIAFAAEPNLMPLPAKYSLGSGRLAIDQNFHASTVGQCGPILVRALDRFAHRLSMQTGIPGQGGPLTSATLEVQCDHASKPIQALGEDESYTLEVDSKQARLNAPNTLGALRGLETFLQLVQQDDEGFAVPVISIQDQPRFPWRGLLLDVCRHWMPIEVVKRTLDGMAAVKMNVFHWHLADDQGFRVESKRFPKLQGMGSDGHYFTQAQVREVIEYARDRGIRVVPEFDIPGHSTSWLVGYPELGTDPGPYQIERHWGIFDPTLDPSKEAVYQFLEKFVGEMAPLFDDQYFHIGGDEVNGKQWTASEHVQAFMKRESLKDIHQFHRYFNRRLQAIVQKHGKRMEGWDEILEPDLPKSIVIQSWRGQKSLNEAVQQGYSGLLSGGYYLDLMQSTEAHYAVDPVDESLGSLTDEQKTRILGGEACMWVEFATHENVDGRIWPRAAAIAERLWSPQSVRNVYSMYTRLDAISRHLETSAGLTHRSAYGAMLQRLAGDDRVEPLRVLADVVEPVKEYTRSSGNPDYTQFTPLNRLVDTVRPESDAGRNLRYSIAAKDWAAVRRTLVLWRDNEALLRPTIERRSLLKEIAPLSTNLSQVAAVGLAALDRIEGRTPEAPTLDASQILRNAAKPVAELLLMAVPGVNALVTISIGGKH
jgi:hexosaminidase